MEWKVGDWAIFNLDIVQIKDIRDSGGASVSEGSFETSGRILERLRPLTLRNKRTIEHFDWYYKQLDKITGERGFNYPRISDHFHELSRKAMDGDEKDTGPFDAARDFVEQAKAYVPVIQGINLFRSK